MSIARIDPLAWHIHTPPLHSTRGLFLANSEKDFFFVFRFLILGSVILEMILNVNFILWVNQDQEVIIHADRKS